MLVASAAAAALLSGGPSFAVDAPTPPPELKEASKQNQSLSFPSSEAPAPKTTAASGLPEGNQWRYSDFIGAVQSGKVERVRFSKDGSQLQLTAVDGRRAAVTLPNDPDLVDTLARNGVDISVSEGEQQGSLVALLGNLLFPLIAFAGLFFLFRRANNGSSGGGMGGMGGMGGGGPMEFGKSKSKFQEVPETGVLFADVAGAAPRAVHSIPTYPVRTDIMNCWSCVLGQWYIPAAFACSFGVVRWSAMRIKLVSPPDVIQVLTAPSWSCARWSTS